MKEEKYKNIPYILPQKIDEILEDYVSSDIENYEDFIKKYENEREYLFLSDIGENILNWYNFKSGSKVLEISNDFGQISNVLLNKDLKVTKYEYDTKRISFFAKRFSNNGNIKFKEFNDIELDKNKYDYIVISDCFKNYDFIQIVEKLLKNDGILIYMFENSLSAHNLSCAKKDGNSYTFEKNNIELLRLLAKLDDIGMTKQNAYYTFPNIYIPSNIYESTFYAWNINEVSYSPCYVPDDIIIMNENDLMNKLTKSAPIIITLFANSYIVEASKNELEKHTSMVSFNNTRKEEYSLITKISNYKVYKLPRSKKADKHLLNMRKGIEKLKAIDDRIFIDKIDENEMYSDYVKNKDTLDKEIYNKYVETENLEDVKEMYENEYSFLKDEFKEYGEVEKNELLNDIPKELLEKMHYLELCPWDMIAKNTFFYDGKYMIFDQEWYEVGLPVEFLIYRSVINTYDLVKKIDVPQLFELLNISEYVEYFDSVNEKIRDKILDKKRCLLYTNNNLKIDNLIYNTKELEIYKENIKGYIENNTKQDDYIKKLEAQLKVYENKKIKNKVKKIFNK